VGSLKLAALGVTIAALVAASFVRFGPSARAFVAAFFVAVLAVLAAIDIEQRIIPNRIVLPAAIVVLAARIAISPGRTWEWVGAALGVFAVFLVVHLVSPAGFGMGDVKLGLLLGAGLGRYVVLGVFVGLLAASAAGLVLIAREGRAARKRTMPMGPFLAVGAIAALFIGAP
jgi:leader peptidase (prepilin peptidase)/N-methyltransferase